MKPTDNSSKTILAIDDITSLLKVMELRLKSRGFRVLSALDVSNALAMARETYIDLAVIDYKLDGENGVEVMEQLQEIQPELPAIILTAYGTIDSAVQAIQRGACNYLTKPFDGDELVRQIETCLEKSRLESGRYPPETQPEQPPFFARVIARSSEMKAVLAKVAQVAVTDSNVYIEGESGTGKELIARCLHAASPRKDGQFIAVNCAAIPENLLESELLEHTEKAILAAITAQPGKPSLQQIHDLVESWLAVEEAIVGGLVYSLVPEVVIRRIPGLPLAWIEADLKTKAKFPKYRLLPRAIQLVRDFGLKESIKLYRQDPVAARNLLEKVK